MIGLVALVQTKANGGDKEMLDLSILLQEIDRQYTLLNKEEMEQYLKEKLAQAEEECGKNSLIYASLANELGAFCRHERRYTEGEKFFLEAAAALATTKGEKSPEYATTLNNLAELYRLSGKHEKAKELVIQSLAIFIESVGERHFLYASALNYLAHLYREEKNYEEALAAYRGALDIVEGLNDNKELLVTSHNNIGQVLRLLGRNGEAESEVQKAKQIMISPSHQRV
jgi:tetratricopeptide (TPR) repeat protein